MTNSTFWNDGYRDANDGKPYSPPEHSATSVYTAEYQRGYNAYYDKGMARISRAHWNRMKRQGYTMVRDGQCYMLTMTDVGTMNVPVRVE